MGENESRTWLRNRDSYRLLVRVVKAELLHPGSCKYPGSREDVSLDSWKSRSAACRKQTKTGGLARLITTFYCEFFLAYAA